MYRKIVVPVDLAHADRLEKALLTAGALAKLFSAPVVYVGVTGPVPDSVARGPDAYRQRLEDFARAQAEAHGIETSAHPIVSGDPAAELSRLLRRATQEVGADLVIMASHPPSALDWILPSQGGSVAEHAEASVFVVR